MRPDPNRLLAGGGCGAPWAGEEGAPEEQKHHGGGVQVLLCCNLSCRERGHSSSETNHFLFWQLTFGF